MGRTQAPEIKQGNRGSRRVYWVHCPRCGDGKEHVARIAAKTDLKNHDCDG